MGYTQTQNYINSLNSRGIVPGLDNIKALLNQLSNPHHGVKFIHIAGTNGKGSVGAYLSEILQCSGSTVTRFVSPCVGDYKNTYLCNGTPVSEDVISSATEIVKDAMTALSDRSIFPTAFETEVAIAFVAFSMISPDYVIVECGMGGKNDATNSIPPPVLAVITKISMDHMQFLGNSAEEIAREKAGIIKKGTTLITTPQENSVIKELTAICEDLSVPVLISEIPEDVIYNDNTTSFKVNNSEYITSMLGAYQPYNASIAIKCAERLGVTYNNIYNGIKKAYWEYRFECIDNFILDGAHNPDGARALAESVKLYCKGGKTAFICGCFKDKDYDSIAKLTAHLADTVYCIKAPTSRGLNPEILCDTFKKYGAQSYTMSSLEDAIKKSSDFNKIVIFGTLSILHEAKQIIERDK